MMFRGRIAAVSYLNTIPFIYGIEHAGFMRAGLILSPPSRCAEAYAAGEADIALVPVAALPELPDAHIITSFCIGARNPVRTVTIMTDSEPSAIRRVFLDSHSRTSVVLAKVLCHDLWNIRPRYIEMSDYSVADTAAEGDAFLFIGDKVFDYEGRFRHTFDLAECWKELTGLPFVFAVWIARNNVPGEVIEALQASLSYGIDHIPQAISYYGHSGKSYAYDYLTNNIDFVFDEQKQRSLSLFWDKGLKFHQHANPG